VIASPGHLSREVLKMANRSFKDGAKAIEAGLVSLYGRIVVGASGAITSQDCRGFSAALNASPGVYDVTLDDSYPALRMLNVNVIDAVAAGEGKIAQVISEAVSTADNGILSFTVVATDDGLAADVASGGIILIEIILKNSSVTY